MAAGTIAKPQMRKLLEAKIKVALIGAVASSILSGFAWYGFVSAPRKAKYAEFYKTYDPMKHLKIMCDAGLMESCGPNKK